MPTLPLTWRHVMSCSNFRFYLFCLWCQFSSSVIRRLESAEVDWARVLIKEYNAYKCINEYEWRHMLLDTLRFLLTAGQTVPLSRGRRPIRNETFQRDQSSCTQFSGHYGLSHAWLALTWTVCNLYSIQETRCHAFVLKRRMFPPDLTQFNVCFNA